jgi:hypothetical protein
MSYHLDASQQIHHDRVFTGGRLARLDAIFERRVAAVDAGVGGEVVGAADAWFQLAFAPDGVSYRT